ncbi:MAG: MinD/ParA family protein [Synergistaceae bacterium]|jgi:flagellar biosynthesis protein FlhG|nr:MinD/ParA family protein [Synergistaceae bacterium]
MNPVIMPPPAIDQATRLRELVLDRKDASAGRSKITGVRSVSILSGKGGVGKSNLAVNMALAIANQGMNVTLLDADLGLANIDILFGVVPKFNLGHVLRGEKELSDILFRVGERLTIVPGGSGLRELADIDSERQAWMIDRLSFLENDTDVLIFDTSAGLHRNVLAFAMASDLSVLVTTPEPTAIRDSYSVLKSLWQSTGGNANIGLVVNMAQDKDEAESVSYRILSAAEQFLGCRARYLGCILWDAAIRDSVKKRRPLLLSNERAVSVQCFKDLAGKVFEPRPEAVEAPLEVGGTSFLRRLINQMTRKKAD